MLLMQITSKVSFLDLENLEIYFLLSVTDHNFPMKITFTALKD